MMLKSLHKAAVLHTVCGQRLQVIKTGAEKCLHRNYITLSAYHGTHYGNQELLAPSNTTVHTGGPSADCASYFPCKATCLKQPSREFSMQSLSYIYSPDFPPVHYAQKTLEFVHDSTGLPWWCTILATTVVLRTMLTLPLAVYSQRVTAKVRGLFPEIAEKGKQLKAEVAVAMKKFNWDEKHARQQYIVNMKRIIKELYIRDNCHPFKASLVAWVQLPVWVGMSLALRNMSGRTPFKSIVFDGALRPDLATEGTLWFTNFMLPDPTFILPLTCGLVNLFIVEMNVIGQKNPSRLQRYAVNFMRGTSLIMIPIGAIVPSCMCYYWTCSTLYGLAQNVAMQYPGVRRAVGIPPLPEESATPMADKWTLFKDKFRRKSRDKTESDDTQGQ